MPVIFNQDHVSASPAGRNGTVQSRLEVETTGNDNVRLARRVRIPVAPVE